MQLPQEHTVPRGFRGFLLLFCGNFWPILKLNWIFLLSCVPIVTIPAALSALSKTTLGMVRGDCHFPASTFFETLRREFWRALAAGAVVLACLGAALVSLRFYFLLAQNARFFLLLAGVALVLAILVWMASVYVFALLSFVDLPMKAVFKNAALMIFVGLKQNFLLLLLRLLGLSMCILSYPGSFFFVIMLMFSLDCLLSSFLVYPILEKNVLCDRADAPAEPE